MDIAEDDTMSTNVSSDLCVDTYELAVCKFHFDNMSSKEVSALWSSNVKTDSSLILSRFSGSWGSPPLSLCVLRARVGCLYKSPRDVPVLAVD